MNYKKIIAGSLLCIFLIFTAGCTTATLVTDEYTGPISYVKDSVYVHTGSKADFFYLDKFENKTLQNSALLTRTNNSGMGMAMKPYIVDRKVPSGKATVVITGATQYAADALAIFGKNYKVSGVIEANFEPDTQYEVKGELSKDYSVVWIEDTKTGKIIGEKIEKR